MRFTFQNDDGSKTAITMPLDGSVKPHPRVFTEVPVEAFFSKLDLEILGTELTDEEYEEFFPSETSEVEAAMGDANHRPSDYAELAFETYTIARDAWEKNFPRPAVQTDTRTSMDPDGTANDLVQKGYTIVYIGITGDGYFVVSGIREV